MSLGMESDLEGDASANAKLGTTSDLASPFEELVASRKRWIEEVLRPWCRQVSRVALLQAHREWTDIAGKVDPEMTLWLWAWSRFPALYIDGLNRLDETYEVRVTTRGGEVVTGFPNARESEMGRLVLVNETRSPVLLSLDDIADVERV